MLLCNHMKLIQVQFSEGRAQELSSDYKRGSYESHKVKELLL